MNQLSNSTSQSVVELTGVHKSFSRSFFKTKKERVLEQASLAFHPGRIVGLFGPSGSGKTTLGNIALGLIRPDKGKVLWNGHDLSTLDALQKKILRSRFQKVFQDPALTFAPFQTLDKSFQDAIRFLSPGREVRRLTRKKLADLMQEMRLDMDLLKRTPQKISGGEIQRLALIRCFLTDPMFLVADEPTSRLDPLVQAQVARLIQSQAPEKGMGVLFISHDFELLKAICHEVLRLENGTLIPAWPTG